MIVAIKIVEEWCAKNDMEMNNGKSAILVLKLDNKTRNVFKDNQLREVPVLKEYKYIGIIFTDTASTNNFVEGKKKVIIKIAHQIKNAFGNSSVPLVRLLATK